MDKVSFVIILVIFILIFIILVASLFFFFFKKEKNIEKIEHILVFFEIDLQKWRIKRIHSLLDGMSNELSQKFNMYLDEKIGSGWVNISTIFEIISKDDEKHFKKAIEYCVQNKTGISITRSFNIRIFKNKKPLKFYFDFNLKYINDTKINLECKSKDLIEDEHLFKKTIKKNELINNEKKYKLFVSFSTNDISHYLFVLFVVSLDKMIRIKNVNYFRSNSMVVLVLESNDYKRITRWSKTIQKRIEKKVIKSNINGFFDGVAFVECQDLKTETDFAKVMTRIVFCLVKSKLQKSPIKFNLKNIHFNEFEIFKEKIMDINKIIESKSIEYETYPILSIKSKKESFDFLYPKLNLNDGYWNNLILKINDYDSKIRDIFVESILKNQDKIKLKEKNKILISINDYYMTEILDKVKGNKKFIFIIHRVKYKSVKDFIQLLKLLKLLKIEYGLYIEEFDSEVFSIISNMIPKTIVLSKEFNSNLAEIQLKDKFKIISAIFLLDKFNINLIFTNASDQIKKEVELLSKKEKYFIEKDLAL